MSPGKQEEYWVVLSASLMCVEVCVCVVFLKEPGVINLWFNQTKHIERQTVDLPCCLQMLQGFNSQKEKSIINL